MAFCTGCGTKLEESARFCTVCGTPANGMASSPSPTPLAQPTPAGGGSALKIILIVVLVLVGLGILSAVSITWFGLHLVRSIKVDKNAGTITTPFGSIAGGSGSEVARKFGVEVYPGAISAGGGGVLTIGNTTVGGAEFDTNDPAPKVISYYRLHYPNSVLQMNTPQHGSLAIATPRGLIGVDVEQRATKTHIAIGNTGTTNSDPEPK